MEKDISFSNKEGEKLVGYLHVPENSNGKGVVLSHCFTCSRHIKVLRELCTGLSGDGFAVLRFDFSGNGESEGSFKDSNYSKQVNDLQSAVDFMNKQGIKEVGMAGHSMGAASAILAGAVDNRIVSLLVLASPSSTKSVKTVFSKEKIDEIYEKGEGKVEVAGKEYVLDKDYFENAKGHTLLDSLHDSHKPICIIHGKNDDTVLPSCAHDLMEAASGTKELHIIDADHMFSSQNMMKEVVDIATKWFSTTL